MPKWGCQDQKPGLLTPETHPLPSNLLLEALTFNRDPTQTWVLLRVLPVTGYLAGSPVDMHAAVPHREMAESGGRV